MILIDCKSVREEILSDARFSFFKNLVLAIIRVGDDYASGVYIRNKVKTAESVGINAWVIECDKNIEFESLKARIASVSQLDTVTGVILQLPLPEHLKKHERELIDTIPPDKDVDGLTSTNIARLWTGQPGLVPATPGAILSLLPEDLSGKVVTIVNRSDLIGKPLVKLLLDRNATVNVCHSKTWFLHHETRYADIVITAIGIPKYFNSKHYFSNGQTWIDCGINRDENGKLCGDVDIDSIQAERFNITPVPGGVGILTTAQLMYNVLKANALQRGIYYD